MSHTVTTSVSPNQSGIAIFTATIVNYVSGGEQFAASDFRVTSILNVIMGNVPASANSLGVPLFPILDAGKVRLFQFTAGAPVEIATTTGLNAAISVLIAFA